LESIDGKSGLSLKKILCISPIANRGIATVAGILNKRKSLMFTR